MPQTIAGFASVENRIRSFFVQHNLGHLLRQSNIRKEKGVRLDSLFQFLLALAFTGKNLFRLLQSSESPEGIGKDCVYWLLNSAIANWRRFLALLSTRVIVRNFSL